MTEPPSAPAPGGPTRPDREAPSQPERPRRRAWWWVVSAILLVVVALLLYAGAANRAKSAKTTKPPPLLPVSTVVARKGDIGVYVKALGAVTPLATVMVKSRVDGQLMTVNYSEGQMVKAGDSLAEIDPRPFQAQLEQAEGQLARDKALLENAHVDLDRYQTALSKNAIPKQQLDTQVATVHQYEGAVKFDEGQVDTAKLQLVYCHITSPITGRVGLRLVDAGNIVHATDTNPLAVITQLQPITVVFSVAEDHLPEIEQHLEQPGGLKVEAFDRAEQKELATGSVLALDSQIDPSTGTIKIKAQFDNEDNGLFPNQFVNVKLLVNTQHDVTVVPTPVVQRNAQTAFVYLVKPDQTIALQNVSVGTTDGNQTSVQGLNPGATVVADNFNRLQEGMKVAVRTAADKNPTNSQSSGPGTNASP